MAQEMEPRARTSGSRKQSRRSRYDDERRPSRKEREERDSGVYVYSTPVSGDSRSRRPDSREDVGPAARVSRSGTHRRTRAISPERVTRYDEVEVIREPSPLPDPKLNRATSVRDPPRPVMTRPSLRRTNTTKGASVANDASVSASPPNHGRRNSGIFGLFRHVPNPDAGAEKEVRSPVSVVEHSAYASRYACIICMDDVPASRCPKLSCGHRMCHACLRRQFQLSVKDPQHMPPTCCTPEHIPLKHVDRLFDPKFKVLWNKKYQEYTSKNRIYCPTRGCGEWIKPSQIRMDSAAGRKYGKCTRCRTKVCVKCNAKWHSRKECPKDEETQRFAEMAKQAGWQRCYNCKAMVELKEGCNHMTCRCTAQFCMLCGLKWKTCECPWFNYAHLDDDDRLGGMRVPEPYVVIERDAPGRRPPPNPLHQPFPDAYPVPPPRRHHPIYAQDLTTGQPARARSIRSSRARGRDPDRERTDEMMAHRLQSQLIDDAANDVLGRGTGMRRSARREEREPEIEVEVIGVGNAAGHHMNESFRVGTAAGGSNTAARSDIRRTQTRRATERDHDRARDMGYGTAGTGRRTAEASVMAGLADDGRRTGLGRVGMWLAYVENDPAEVEGRTQRGAGVDVY